MADETPSFPDIADLGYETARDELVAIVARLEAGQAPLEGSMQLWRRGEALATHCANWLDGAQAEIERAGRPAPAASAPTAEEPLHADSAVFEEP